MSHVPDTWFDEIGGFTIYLLLPLAAAYIISYAWLLYRLTEYKVTGWDNGQPTYRFNRWTGDVQHYSKGQWRDTGLIADRYLLRPLRDPKSYNRTDSGERRNPA